MWNVNIEMNERERESDSLGLEVEWGISMQMADILIQMW